MNILTRHVSIELHHQVQAIKIEVNVKHHEVLPISPSKSIIIGHTSTYPI